MRLTTLILSLICFAAATLSPAPAEAQCPGGSCPARPAPAAYSAAGMPAYELVFRVQATPTPVAIYATPTPLVAMPTYPASFRARQRIVIRAR